MSQRVSSDVAWWGSADLCIGTAFAQIADKGIVEGEFAAMKSNRAFMSRNLDRSNPEVSTSYRQVTHVVAILVALLGTVGSLVSQSRPTVPTSEYGKWETIRERPVLSGDGVWMAYLLERVNKERELRVRALEGDQKHVFAWGASPSFSNDSRWLAWAVGVSEAEKEKLQKAKKPVRLGAGLLNLEKNEKSKYELVQSFSFDKSGRFLALFGYSPEAPDEDKKKSTQATANLRVIHLEQGTEIFFGNIAEYAWSDEDSVLAMALYTGQDEGNGVQVFDAPSGRLTSLDSSGSAYRQLAWRDEAIDLAVLRSADPASKDGSAYQVLAWTGLDREEHQSWTLSQEAMGWADDLEVVRHMKPTWSDDGRLAIGLRPVADPGKDIPENEEKDQATDPENAADEAKQEKEDEEKLPALQIWHSSDVRIFPEQKASEKRDAERVLLAVWHVGDGQATQISTDLMERTRLLEGWEAAVEKVSKPYPWGAMFGRPYHDVWLIDTRSGDRKKVLEKVRYSWESASGRYLLSFDGKDYWTLDVKSGQSLNLTADVPTKFADQEYDTPTDLLPPYGLGGWLENDEAVLLYDRFDIWKLSPGGSVARRLTAGAEEEVVHRLEDLDPDEDAFDPKQPLYFSIRGEWSEKRGYAFLRPGSATVARPVFEDRFFRWLQKAEEAEVLTYRSESRAASPNVFAAGPDLAAPRQVTDTNPFQSDYAWTHAELFEFKSESDRRLQAALLYPAKHDPARLYPMIVYTYEILTPQVHLYEVPSERDYYNFTAWTQRGYFVLLPDIVYRPREPGVSALESVRPAIRRVVEMGRVDPERVGLIGHSWGGYQATYLPTRTNVFAASVAGAPLTDFVSFMGQIHWNPGVPELTHWETGQGRMEVPFWEDPEAHRRNSPIHKVHEMETPLLMAFGKDDGVVDWDQGTEFYNFARRAGKQMVLLVYEGENHGFRTEANQVDYHRRILEWFGHYLKDEPAPDWISKGIEVDKLDDEKRRVAEPPSQR